MWPQAGMMALTCVIDATWIFCRHRLRCRPHRFLRRLFLQRHHRLGPALLLRFVHQPITVDQLLQFVEHASVRRGIQSKRRSVFRTTKKEKASPLLLERKRGA